MSDNHPIFLPGAARSGTTMLYKALCLHPEAAWISNWAARYPAVPWLAALNRLAPLRPELRQRVWFGEEASNAYVYGRRRAWWERAFPMPVEGEPVYRHCGIQEFPGMSAPVAPARQQEALRAAFEAVRRAGGGRHLVSKRIANNLRIPLLAAAFPSARWVSITRDGRAVAYSLSRVDWWEDNFLWWYGGTPRRWRQEGGDPWEVCARNWVEEMRELEQGLQAVVPAQVLELSYESFVAAPVETLEKVADFAGLSVSPAWRARLLTLRFPNQNEAWRSRLEPEAVETIERIQGDVLRRYGYAC